MVSPEAPFLGLQIWLLTASSGGFVSIQMSQVSFICVKSLPFLIQALIYSGISI